MEKKDEFDELVQTLEQRTNWDGRGLVKYQGFWCPLSFFRPLYSAQNHFKSKDTDITLATMPKAGTTWLKALAFSIANRHIYPDLDQTPLLTCSPHMLAPFIEHDLYIDQDNPDLEHLPSPRIFSTHVHFNALPVSIIGSGSKIIYICRNPLDQFVSYRHFSLETKFEKGAVPLELDESFDMFCEGVHPYGPCLDHMVGYWNAHLENPEKVLFLKYEDLKEDITSNVRKIAAFIGCPFTSEEEKRGVVEEIARLCSFENLKNVEVNKNGCVGVGAVKNSLFFRKGQVGDWANYLTPAMAQRMKKMMQTKFEGSALTFNTC